MQLKVVLCSLLVLSCSQVGNAAHLRARFMNAMKSGNDPTCASGLLSLPMGTAGIPYEVCCPKYCGACNDYDTCKNVNGQASANACCASRLWENRCGAGAPANTCIHRCTKHGPPCVMDEVIKMPEVTHNAGDDCNEAVKDWRKLAENTMEAAKTAAVETHYTWALKDALPKAKAECDSQLTELATLLAETYPALRTLNAMATDSRRDEFLRTHDQHKADTLKRLMDRAIETEEKVKTARTDLDLVVDQKDGWDVIGQKKDIMVKECAALKDEIKDIDQYFFDTHNTTPPPPIQQFETVDFGDPNQWYYLDNKADGDAHEVVKHMNLDAKVSEDMAAAAEAAANKWKATAAKILQDAQAKAAQDQKAADAEAAAAEAKAAAEKAAADLAAAKTTAEKAAADAKAAVDKAMESATCAGQQQELDKFIVKASLTIDKLELELQDLIDPNVRSTLKFLHDGWSTQRDNARAVRPDCPNDSSSATREAQEALEDGKNWEETHTADGLMHSLGTSYADLLSKGGHPSTWNVVDAGWKGKPVVLYILGGVPISSFSEEYPKETEEQSEIVFSQLCYKACEVYGDECKGADVYGAVNPHNPDNVQFGCKMMSRISIIAVAYEKGAFNIQDEETGDVVAATTDSGFLMPGVLEATKDSIGWYEKCDANDSDSNDCRMLGSYSLRAVSELGVPL